MGEGAMTAKKLVTLVAGAEDYLDSDIAERFSKGGI